MNTIRVSRVLFVPLLVSAGYVTAPAIHAQSNNNDKVLVIEREFTKPGKDGAVHEATEAGFIRAVQANKGNIHYIALTSMSGLCARCTCVPSTGWSPRPGRGP